MMKKMHPKFHSCTAKIALALTSALSFSAIACPSEAFTGTICVTAANYCPEDGNGYLVANGQSLPVSQYQMLYAVIGNIYGGNQSAFNLPDFAGRVPVGQGQGPGTSPVVLGQKRGAESTTLNANTMALHNHTATLTPAGTVAVTIPISNNTNNPVITPDAAHGYLSGSSTTYPAAIWTDTPTKVASIKGVTGTMNGVAATVSLNPAGGAASGTTTPTPTLPPQLGLTYCIASNGVFPVRP